ncbi:MAG: hypothetical protein Q9M31_00390 [Mariprofundus sp.]|nr:hypothetical protein [Mariprofundus sp.]
MHKWRLFTLLLLTVGISLSACGRKEAPQISTGDEKPQINNLRDQVVGNVLELKFTLTGMAKGVGFHVDRTQIDPYCHCPGFWRRFYDRPALPVQVGVESKRLIKLKNDTVEYLFRIRAYDIDGNLGPWSHAIHAKGVDLSR